MVQVWASYTWCRWKCPYIQCVRSSSCLIHLSSHPKTAAFGHQLCGLIALWCHIGGTWNFADFGRLDIALHSLMLGCYTSVCQYHLSVEGWSHTLPQLYIYWFNQGTDRGKPHLDMKYVRHIWICYSTLIPKSREPALYLGLRTAMCSQAQFKTRHFQKIVRTSISCEPWDHKHLGWLGYELTPSSLALSSWSVS